ncbi:MAG: tetratricopeptide repeat protein [Desulfobulbaceae bacterium]|nr:tetratricopeptide repeat protein [Desulfobulbaceae bacterium]
MTASCVPAVAPSVPAVPSSVAKPAAVPRQEGEADTQCSYFYFLWGKTAESKEQYEEALDAYEKAVVCDAEADYVIRHLTLLLLRMDRRQQALEWGDKLIQAHPEDRKVKMFQADLYGSMGEDAKSIAIYESLLQQQPTDPELLLKLGRQYLNSLDYLKARDYFEKLVAVEPDSFMGYYYLARLYRELKFSQKAFAAYKKALSLNWTLPLAVEAAEFYESQKMWDEAITLYEGLLDDEDSSEEAANRLVRIYLAQNQTDKALAVLQDLRKNATDSQKIDFTVGRIFMEQHKYPEAISIFKEMLARDPELVLARSLLAMAYYESGAHAEAKALLLAVKREDNAYEEALSLLIKMYAEEKEFPEAITLVKKAIAESKGETENYYFALASLYEEQGKLAEAEKVLLDTTHKFPKSGGGYFTYGMFLERYGRLDEAMAQMEKVLAVNPNDPLALNYIGYSWAERGINLSQALEYIQKAVAQRPDDGFILDSLGWVYFRRGELQQAVDALEKAILLEPEDPTIHEHLGDVYVASHQTQLALDNYTKSLSLSDKEEDKARVTAKIEAIKP